MKNLIFSVNKNSGNGQIEYKIHLETNGQFKLQILKNDLNGSFNSKKLSLEEALTLTKNASKNNNDKAFFSAILKDLGLIS